MASQYVEEAIKLYEKRVYGEGGMSAHQRAILRKQLEKEERDQERMEKIQDQEFKWGEPRS